MPGEFYTHFLRCSATECTTFSLITGFSSWVIFIHWLQLHKQTRTSSISGELVEDCLSLRFIRSFVGDEECNLLPYNTFIHLSWNSSASGVFYFQYRMNRVQLFKQTFIKIVESLPWDLWVDNKYFQDLWRFVLIQPFRILDLNILQITVKVSCHFKFALSENIFQIKINVIFEMLYIQVKFFSPTGYRLSFSNVQNCQVVFAIIFGTSGFKTKLSKAHLTQERSLFFFSQRREIQFACFSHCN